MLSYTLQRSKSKCKDTQRHNLSCPFCLYASGVLWFFPNWTSSLEVPFWMLISCKMHIFNFMLLRKHENNTDHLLSVSLASSVTARSDLLLWCSVVDSSRSSCLWPVGMLPQSRLRSAVHHSNRGYTPLRMVPKKRLLLCRNIGHLCLTRTSIRCYVFFLLIFFPTDCTLTSESKKDHSDTLIPTTYQQAWSQASPWRRLIRALCWCLWGCDSESLSKLYWLTFTFWWSCTAA